MGEANWVCLQDCTTLRTELSRERESTTQEERLEVSAIHRGQQLQKIPINVEFYGTVVL